MVCIPRPSVELSILWWVPMDDDAPFVQGTAIIVNVRILKANHVERLRVQLDECTKIAFLALALQPSATLLSSLVTHARQCLECLGFGLSMSNLLLTLADLQCSCLDIRALAKYLQDFHPRS